MKNNALHKFYKDISLKKGALHQSVPGSLSERKPLPTAIKFLHFSNQPLIYH